LWFEIIPGSPGLLVLNFSIVSDNPNSERRLLASEETSNKVKGVDHPQEKPDGHHNEENEGNDDC
jgi:hypothetical protein